MPSVPISTEGFRQLLLGADHQTTITTQLGRCIVEIQGDLEIPTHELKSITDAQLESGTYNARNDIVRIGSLEIDDSMETATLYIGKKQRLLGKVVKLEMPLGLLKFNERDSSVELCDLLEYKVLFTDRPLPIM